MLTQDTILLLAEMALQNYLQGIRPDAFAAIAAYQVTAATAAQFNVEAADAAAITAASSFIDSAVHAAQQADAITKVYSAMKKPLSNSGEGSPTLSFTEVMSSFDNMSIGKQAHDLYDEHFDAKQTESVLQAKEAALRIYTHAYTCCRAAYTHAIALSAQYDDAQRNLLFKEAIIQRLTTDLLYESLAPSFLMKVLCSDAMKVASVIMLIAGLALLTLGTCGLIIPSVGASLAGTAALITTVGAMVTTAGSALVAGSFFAKNQWQNDREKSRKAVEEINQYELEESTATDQPTLS